MNGWGALLWFLASLLVMAWFGRWMSGLVQGVGWLLFRDERAVFLVTFVVFLPGIVLHELSHWVMARLLGMRPHQLSLWPKARGQRVEMGSVRVRSGGTLRDSLTGLAPLLVGTLILLLISYQVFDAASLQQAWARGGLSGAWDLFWSSFKVPNAWLWAYFVFAVSNSMLPSSSDRQPLLSLLLYAAIVGVFFYVVGWLPRLILPTDLVTRMVHALRTLSTAFAFTIALDILIALPLLLTQVLLLPFHRE